MGGGGQRGSFMLNPGQLTGGFDQADHRRPAEVDQIGQVALGRDADTEAAMRCQPAAASSYLCRASVASPRAAAIRPWIAAIRGTRAHD